MEARSGQLLYGVEYQMGARQLNRSPLQKKYSILVSCGKVAVCSKIEKALSRGPEYRLSVCNIADSDTPLLPSAHPQMIIVCHEDRKNLYRALEEIGVLRAGAYKGIVAVLTDEPCVEDLLHALRLGADEYLYNGPKLKLLAEVQRMVATGRQAEAAIWFPEKVGRIGLFRSVGLSPFQVRILVEYTKDFPRLRELSERTKTSETNLRKTFSLIYNKLREPLAIETQSQLAQLLTICASVGPFKHAPPKGS